MEDDAPDAPPRAGGDSGGDGDADGGSGAAGAGAAADRAADDTHESDEESGDTKEYCLCNGKGSGDMVGCDGPGCVGEWFHLTCVGLTRQPKSRKWFCPTCRTSDAR